MNKEGEIKIPPCKANFLDLDKYSGEVYSESPVVNVGKIITLEGSSPQPEGSTSSNEEKDETSDPSTGGTEEDYEDTPGFGFFLAVAGILMGTGFIMKKKA